MIILYFCLALRQIHFYDFAINEYKDKRIENVEKAHEKLAYSKLEYILQHLSIFHWCDDSNGKCWLVPTRRKWRRFELCSTSVSNSGTVRTYINKARRTR
jgi:hypothetical protein